MTMPLSHHAQAFPCPIPGCAVFPYDRREDLAEHLLAHVGEMEPRPAGSSPLAPVLEAPTPVPTESGRFERVPNGFGGTTTRRAQPRAQSSNAPHPNRVKFLKQIMDERAGNPDVEALRVALNQAAREGKLDRTMVADAIERVLAIPKPRARRA